MKPNDGRPNAFHSDSGQKIPKPSGITDADFTYRITVRRPELNMHIVLVANHLDELNDKIKEAEDKARKISGENPNQRDVRYAKKGGAANAALAKLGKVTAAGA